MNSRSWPYLRSIIAVAFLGGAGVTCANNSPFADIREGDNPQEDIPHCHRGLAACAGCSDQFGCVECEQDSDCHDVIGGPRALCVFGYCSRCRANDECNAGMACSPRSRSCEPQCTSNAECGGNYSVCSSSHACVECSSNTDCPGERPLCDQELGRCSQCVSAKDCSEPTSICDRRRGVCAECMIDGDCWGPGIHAICDAEAICRLSCADDADCTDPDAPICTDLAICVGSH